MTTTTFSAAAPRGGRTTLAILVLAALAAIAFVWVAAVPYLTLNQERFGPFWPDRVPLLVHISGGMLAILSGPVQLWLGLTDRHPALHRRLGYLYITGVSVGAATAYYLAVHAMANTSWVYGTGLAGFATAWSLTTGLAVAAIKRSLLDQHREWMIRSYVVTFGFVIVRALFVILQTLRVGTDEEANVAAAWACWAVPLIVTEAIIQGRKIFSVAPVL